MVKVHVLVSLLSGQPLAANLGRVEGGANRWALILPVSLFDWRRSIRKWFTFTSITILCTSLSWLTKKRPEVVELFPQPTASKALPQSLGRAAPWQMRVSVFCAKLSSTHVIWHWNFVLFLLSRHLRLVWCLQRLIWSSSIVGTSTVSYDDRLNLWWVLMWEQFGEFYCRTRLSLNQPTVARPSGWFERPAP